MTARRDRRERPPMTDAPCDQVLPSQAEYSWPGICRKWLGEVRRRIFAVSPALGLPKHNGVRRTTSASALETDGNVLAA